MKKIDFSLVLPCYNEGPTFEKSVAQVLRELNRIKERWEIIFVEDKSLDGTKAEVEKLVLTIPNSRAIYHKQNEGRGKSVADAIKKARGSICGFMDVDCEISPAYIPIFISEIKKGYDMAIANRFYEGRLKSVLRFIASITYSKIVSSLLKLPLSDTEAGFKFFNKDKIVPVVKKTQDKRWFWDTEICARAYYEGLKISEVPVLFNRKIDKKSTVKLIPDSLEYLKRIFEFRSKIKKEGGY